MLRVAFAYAERVGAIAAGTNPAARVKATAARKVERYLDAAERAALDAALARADQLGAHMKDAPRDEHGGLAAHMVRVLRLLALTGMRRGEVLGLRWENVDWSHGVLRLPTSKTGAKPVPLTPQAIAFLRAEQKREGVKRMTGLVCATPATHRFDHDLAPRSIVEAVWLHTIGNGRG